LEVAIRTLALCLTLCTSTLLSAQNQTPAVPHRPHPDLRSHPEWPKALPEDVDTIEHAVRAFYSAISAPAGGKLDRARLRSLFVPEGRIISSSPPTASATADIVVMSPDEYADVSDAYTAKASFFDKNVANQIEQFGVMAHVYSTYESRSRSGDATPVARGIKSIELLNSGGRWYIVHAYWDCERPDNLLPDAYLHDSHK
jgi:hypothetical protein